MAKVDGINNLKVEANVLVPQIEVRLRPSAAEQFGLTPGQVRRAVTTVLRGTKVGEVYEGQRKQDVVVWGNAQVKNRSRIAGRTADRYPDRQSSAAEGHCRYRDCAGPERGQT